ncbi:MAG: DUF6476 family protein [Hyphomicrobiaceae bacterium]|nr:DUF6476 family protein [Hyphomicrobiaceae bacterium]
MTDSTDTAVKPDSTTAEAGEVPFIERPETVRALRIVVFAMGVVLVLGFVAVIGRIVYLVSRPTAPAPIGVGVAAGAPTAAGRSGAIDLALPAGAQIRTLALDGDRLAVHHISPDGAGIVVIDIASGNLMSRIRLTPDVPAGGVR